MQRIAVPNAPKNDQPVDIAMASDKAFLPFCAATIMSVIENSIPTDVLRFHILCDRYPPMADVEKFQKLVEGRSARIEFVPASAGAHADLKTNRGISAATYYRLKIDALLPGVRKVVYIDSDLVVLGRIKDLASIDMGDNLIVGVEDGSSKGHKYRSGQDPDTGHVNGGVLVMDLEGLRKANFATIVDNYVAAKGPTIIMGDQQILNHALEGKIGYVGAEWNLHGSMHDETWRALNCGIGNTYKLAEIEEAYWHPKIIHFTSNKKPWQQGGGHPHGGKFLRYLRRSPYGDQYRTLVPSDRVSEVTPADPKKIQDGLNNFLIMKELAERNKLAPVNIDTLRERFGAGAAIATNAYEDDINGGNAQNHKILFQTNKLMNPSRDPGWESCDFIVLVKWFNSDAIQLQLLSHALTQNKPVLFVETTFFGAFATWAEKQLAPQARQPVGFIIDDLAFYFDSTRHTRLELTLNAPSFSISNEQAARARSIISRIVKERLTKYNSLPDTHIPRIQEVGGYSRAVLVVDQGANDSSIELGCASSGSFLQMLRSAIEENQDAYIIVKTHPDSVAKGRPSHFAEFSGDKERVTFISTKSNPHSLLDHVDTVYTVTSQLGFEALLRQKRVVLFGAPFYAGWGLTEDRVPVKRRTATRTIEEIFHAACIEHSVYVNPETGQSCPMEEALDIISAMKLEDWPAIKMPPTRRSLNDEIKRLQGYKRFASFTRHLQGKNANVLLEKDPDSYFSRRRKGISGMFVWKVGRNLKAAALENIRRRLHLD